MREASTSTGGSRFSHPDQAVALSRSSWRRDLGERDARPAAGISQIPARRARLLARSGPVARLTAEALADSEFLPRAREAGCAAPAQVRPRADDPKNKASAAIAREHERECPGLRARPLMARYCRDAGPSAAEPQEREAQEMREPVSCSGELPVAQDLEVAQDGDSAGAPDGDSAVRSQGPTPRSS